MSHFTPVLSKTTKRLLKDAPPKEQTPIVNSVISKVMIASCAFCQGAHNVEHCEKRKNTKCRFCGELGHTANVRFCQALATKVVRDKEREERLNEMVCFCCKQKGHAKSNCPTFIEQNKKREADFPTLTLCLTASSSSSVSSREKVIKKEWKNVVEKNRSEEIVSEVEKANKDALRAKAAEKAKKHADYLARGEAREQRAAEKKQREEAKQQAYIQEMREKYGSRWFNFVQYYKDGELDSAIAADLRYEWEREQEENEWQRDQEEARICREIDETLDRKEAEKEHNQKTMTPEQFRKWEWEQQEEEWDDDDAYFSQGMDADYNYTRCAPPEYANYCFRTSVQLDYGAKVLENERLMNEWKKEKEENEENEKKNNLKKGCRMNL